MARFAPVVPIHVAEALQGADVGEDSLGGYHLLLAHDVLARPEDYQRVYGKVRERFPESFIILDNSIVELGSAMKMKDLIEAAVAVQPDCIVVPDVMGDGAETRVMSRAFVREYVRYMESRTDSPWPLMGVLQGVYAEDCMETCALFYTLPLVEFISVPRIVTEKQGSRMSVLIELAKRETYNLFEGVHLLGFSDDVLDDVACTRVPFVQGIDSAVPVRAGLKGVPMVLALTRPGQFKAEVGPRGDFWNTPLTSGQLAPVNHNLQQYRSWLK